MARQIPSNQKFLTVSNDTDTPERKSSRASNAQEYYTIDDLIYTAVGPGVSGNAGSLAELISMTNTDGAFSHLNNVYDSGVIPAGTNVEVLLRSMLNPYIEATVTLTSLDLSIRTGTSNSGWGSFTQQGNLALEAGQGFRIKGVTKVVSDSALTLDNSFSFIKANGGVMVTNIPDTTGGGNFPSGIVEFVNVTTPSASGEAHSYRLKGIDNGGGSEQFIYSDYKTVTFYNRVKAGASTESSATNANAAILFLVMSSYNAIEPKSDITFSGDVDTTNADKYTWIIFPVNWGNPIDILQGATSIATDFEPRWSLDITNPHGVASAYYFYRSTSKGAFGVGSNITVKFS